MERRYKRLVLDPHRIRDFFVQGSMSCFRVVEGVPSDADVVSINVDPTTLELNITFEHKDFPAQDFGLVVDRMQPTLQDLRAAILSLVFHCDQLERTILDDMGETIRNELVPYFKYINEALELLDPKKKPAGRSAGQEMESEEA